MVCCGADGTNVDLAAAATRLLGDRRYPLTIFAQLRDLDLWSSLAAEGATFGSSRSGLRLEYFNVFATGAQLLREKHPPFLFDSGADSDEWRAHILIVGLGSMGEHLVLQIARLWSDHDSGPLGELHITLR